MAPLFAEDDVTAPGAVDEPRVLHALERCADVGARDAHVASQRRAVGGLALHLEVVDRLEVLRNDGADFLHHELGYQEWTSSPSRAGATTASWRCRCAWPGTTSTSPGSSTT